jgi:hypothetical protein
MQRIARTHPQIPQIPTNAQKNAQVPDFRPPALKNVYQVWPDRGKAKRVVTDTRR